MWVVGDLDSSDGFVLVKDALRHVQSEGCNSRLGFIHVPTHGDRDATNHDCSSVIHQLVSMSALRTVTPVEVLEVLEHLNEDDASFARRADGPQSSLDQARAQGVRVLALKGYGQNYEGLTPYDAFAKAGTEIARKLGIDGTRPHLIVNGRVSQ